MYKYNVIRFHSTLPHEGYAGFSSPVGGHVRGRGSRSVAEPGEARPGGTCPNSHYDIHGNVNGLIHQNLYAPATLEQNLVQYDYDLVSGVVKKVSYNKHRADRYFHQYAYDDQNRLTHAHTSRNDLKYDQDARYFYYRHGPLARVELGNNKVQGMDYAYTIHGWLKSVNSDALAADIDPSMDGHDDIANPNRYFARDAYGFSLQYYHGDYQPIENAYQQTKDLPGTYGANSLFNGNIAAMNNTLKKPDDYTVLPLLQRFGYDQLNRIAASRAFNDYDFIGNQWNASASALDKYATSYSYDPAGNLLTLNRNGDKTDTLEMDSLKYVYYANTNRLRRVNDAVDASNYGMDIDQQDTLVDNYGYDAIGNLTKDEAEEIEEIVWTVYGKVSEVRRYATSTKPDLQFFYDAGGKRIMKKNIPKTEAPEKTEFYVHDAQGNPLTIYSYLASETPTYKVNEQLIYGSSRQGTWKSDVDLLAYIPEVPEVMTVDRGNKRYEMNDHLSNVHAVVTDRRKRICEEETFTHYEADIRNTYDYYAFGMMMPGRGFSPTTDKPAPQLQQPDWHWSFTGLSLVETNGSGRDGVAYNGPYSTTDECGVTGNAYRFDGWDDYIAVADHADLDFGADDFTVAVWIKKISHKNWAITAAAKWLNGGSPGSNEWLLTIGDNISGMDPPAFFVESGTTIYKTSSSTNVSLGTWYHLVGMRDGDSIHIFLDGVHTGSTYIGSAAINNVGRKLYFANVESGIYTDAEISDVAIYDRALTGQQVADIYASKCGAAIPTQETDIAEGYRFGFNGKEKVDEVYGDANAYDFGARLYDPRIGRWLATDPVSNINPGSSPYRFAKNSPLLFIDAGGNFDIKITEEAKVKYGITEQQLVKMNQVLGNMQTYLKDNPAVVATIARQTGFTPEKILADAEFGKGPTIVVAFDAQSQAYAANVNSTDAKNNELHFDGSILKNFENLTFANDEEAAATYMAMAGLVLHEYTHLGDRQNNNGKLTGQGEQNQNPNGPMDPEDNGIQGIPSRFGHRGDDTETSMYGMTRSVEFSKDGDNNNIKITPRDIRAIQYNLKNSGKLSKVKETFLKKN
jgi:RHS repeat-associated protein